MSKDHGKEEPKFRGRSLADLANLKFGAGKEGSQQPPEQPAETVPTAEQPPAQKEAPAPETAAPVLPAHAETQPQPEKKEKKPAVPLNSRLYRQFAQEYFDNKHGEQNRAGSLEKYLNYSVIGDIKDNVIPLPPGCKTIEDLYKPFWETETVAGISPGSYFVLEHSLAFQENQELQKKHKGSLDRYFRDLLARLPDRQAAYLEANAGRELGDLEDPIGLPEEAKNTEDALRPLSEAEIKTWFNHRKRELEEYYQKQGIPHYKKTAYKAYIRFGYDELQKKYFPERVDNVPVATSGLSSTKEQHPNETQEDFDLHQRPPEELSPIYKMRGSDKNKGKKKVETVPLDKAVQEVFYGKEPALTMQSQSEASEKAIEEAKAALSAVSDESLNRIAGELYNRPDGQQIELEAGEVSPIRNAKFELDANQLKITYEQRKVIKGVGDYDPKPHDLTINLDPEIAANYQEHKAEFEGILRSLVIENNGYWKPQVNFVLNSLNFGLGDFEGIRTIKEISPTNLKTLAPHLHKQLSWYRDLKQKSWRGLDRSTEQVPLQAFEADLFNVPVKNPRSGLQTKLGQMIWDDAFRKAVEAKFTPEQLAEMKQRAESQPASKPAGEAPKSQPRAEAPRPEQQEANVDGFLKKLAERYGKDYLGFLQSEDIFPAMEEFGFKRLDELLSAVAKVVLSPEQLAVFEGLVGMTEKEIVKSFFDNQDRYKNKKKVGLLHSVLIQMLKQGVEPTAARSAGPEAIGQVKGQKEPKLDHQVGDKMIPPDAAYYPAFQSVKKIMDRYGHIDQETLAGIKQETGRLEEQLRREPGNTKIQEELGRLHAMSETFNKQTLEQALDAMGFLEDYKKGLAEYQPHVIAAVRAEQDKMLRQGKQVSEQDVWNRIWPNIEMGLLTKAVESFYYPSPETLEFEAEKLKVPPEFEEVKYVSEPLCVVMKDKLSGYEYFGVPASDGTWERVPLPDGINIEKPEDIKFLYDSFSAMVKKNSRENKFQQPEFHPRIQLKGGPTDGRFEIYVDRKLVKTVPVAEFLDLNRVRRDVRQDDEQNTTLKRLLAKSFDKLQHNQSENFAERDNRLVALEDLLLNTPLENAASVGEQTKLLALKSRMAQARQTRVKGPREAR